MAQPVRVAVFDQTFSGPADGRASAADALRSAGFAVRDGDPLHPDDKGEAAKAWLVAEKITAEPPGTDAQADWLARADDALARADDALARTSFVRRSHGTGHAWRTSEEASRG